ncbi:hypothetical protein QYF61_010840 [Mycteria americana]|uniref:RING-type E3 ubiquitin transferase n=1 Tax=Mycteria americana TaxID=33587 RepID=A0AAN7RT15_MYCAM|nr:hypothetical protein QYF61_010840 [Mycteria americana]
MGERSSAARDGGLSQLPQARPSDAATDSQCPICLGDVKKAVCMACCMHCYCFACSRLCARRRHVCLVSRQPFKQLLHSVPHDDNYQEYVVELPACLRRRLATEKARSQSPQRRYNLRRRPTDDHPSAVKTGPVGDQPRMEAGCSSVALQQHLPAGSCTQQFSGPNSTKPTSAANTAQRRQAPGWPCSCSRPTQRHSVAAAPQHPPLLPPIHTLMLPRACAFHDRGATHRDNDYEQYVVSLPARLRRRMATERARSQSPHWRYNLRRRPTNDHPSAVKTGPVGDQPRTEAGCSSGALQQHLPAGSHTQNVSGASTTKRILEVNATKFILGANTTEHR